MLTYNVDSHLTRCINYLLSVFRKANCIQTSIVPLNVSTNYQNLISRLIFGISKFIVITI